MVVFWIPLLAFAAMLPVGPDWLGRVESAGLYYFALLTSSALLLESSVWSALDQERITRHVERRWRLLAWVKNFAVSTGTMALLWVAWADFLFSAPRLHRLAKDPVLSLVQIGRGLSFVLFPAGLLLAALWAWRNCLRWSVTD